LSGFRNQVYQIQASAGQELFFDRTTVGKSANFNSLLLSDDYPQYPKLAGDNEVMEFTYTGRYFLILEQAASPTTPVELQTHSIADAEPLLFDTVVAGVIDPGVGGKVYKYSAQAGQILFVDTISVTPGGQARIGGSLQTMTPGSPYFLRFERD